MQTDASGSRRSPSIVNLYLQDARRVHGRDITPPKDKIQADSLELADDVRDLVEPHLFYVVQVASEFRSTQVSFEDLLAEGNVGLVEAAHHFDPSHNVKFLTYASWWIRKRILELLNREGKSINLTRYARERHRVVRRAKDELRQKLGREPEHEEIAKVTGMGVEQVRDHSRGSLVVSSLEQPKAGTEILPKDLLMDPNQADPEEQVELRRMRSVVLNELSQLKPRHRMIIENRFGLDGRPAMTFQQLGERLGISRERARQLEREALQRLRRRLARR